MAENKEIASEKKHAEGQHKAAVTMQRKQMAMQNDTKFRAYSQIAVVDGNRPASPPPLT